MNIIIMEFLGEFFLLLLLVSVPMFVLFILTETEELWSRIFLLLYIIVSGSFMWASIIESFKPDKIESSTKIEPVVKYIMNDDNTAIIDSVYVYTEPNKK